MSEAERMDSWHLVDAEGHIASGRRRRSSRSAGCSRRPTAVSLAARFPRAAERAYASWPTAAQRLGRLVTQGAAARARQHIEQRG